MPPIAHGKGNVGTGDLILLLGSRGQGRKRARTSQNRWHTPRFLRAMARDSGVVDGSLRFDGINDYVDAAAQPGRELSSSISLACHSSALMS